jgi:hypothetical protein
MSKPFTDLNLTDEQIASNYSWQQIKNTQEYADSYADSKVLNDPVNNLLFVSNADNTVEQGGGLTDNIVIGTDLTLEDSQSTVVMGHHFNVEEGVKVVKIGGGQTDNKNNVIASQEVVNIGYNNSCNNVGLLVNIGFDNDTQAGVNNIVIGSKNIMVNACNNNVHIGNSLTLVNYDAIESTVVISPNIIPGNTPVSGSVVFGGKTNNAAAADARIQFLSEELSNIGGGAVFPANYFATIPIRYKGVNYRIPVLSDP